MKKVHQLLLSLLTGVLLFLSWVPNEFAWLIFVAFVPLLFVAEDVTAKRVRAPFWTGTWLSFIAFFVWNAGTTWWIWNITPAGAIATIVLNSFFMAVVFGCWQRFRSLQLPAITAPIALISFWGAWELLHLNWDITWPWLNLGNVFCNSTEFVQWYEFTGTFGGTIWIWVANFLTLFFLKNVRLQRKKAVILASSLLLWIALPTAGSLARYYSYQLPDTTSPKAIEVVIVQQNTDPVEEQYELNNYEHAQRIFGVAATQLTPNTRLLLCPETAIPWGINAAAIGEPDCPTFNSSYAWLSLVDSLFIDFPQLNLIIGLSTYTVGDYPFSATAHEIEPGRFVESYNTAACFNHTGLTNLYYKSKLVPGVEKMPYPQIFGFLEKLAIDLGGTSGSLGIDTEQRTHSLQAVPFKVGTAICYESAYGEHFGKFVKNGAQLMTVITNDGWWGNTPGHKQHFLFSKLRAVESRRTILRAANTGISAIVDERGDAHQVTAYNTRCALRAHVCPNHTLTFYVRHGDYLARICLALTILIALFAITIRLRQRFCKIKK